RVEARGVFLGRFDGSDVRRLWPTPGTTTRCPCGNCASTETAPAVGVRRSRPPLKPRTGTSGIGPLGAVMSFDAVGQPAQTPALPSVAAHFPKGPSEPAGRAASAAWIAAGRSASAVVGDHGNGPSSQTLATYSPSLQ